MRNTRSGVVGAIVVALALLVGACGDSGDDTTTTAGGTAGGESQGSCATYEGQGAVTVGSTNFSEQELVASMYAGCLEAAGFDVTTRFQIGSREIVLPALLNGDIDLYPEYVGTALTFLGGTPTSDLEESVTALQEAFGEEITVLEPSAAENKNGFAVTPETAEQYDLQTLSDLAPVAGELTFGGSPECPERQYCLIGLREVYGIEFGQVERLDAGGPLTKNALENGDIDVGLIFTSDGALAARDLVVLEDDRGLQPVENIVPVVRTDVLTDAMAQALNSISAELTTEGLSVLNERIDVERADPAVVAEEWLQENGFTA